MCTSHARRRARRSWLRSVDVFAVIEHSAAGTAPR
jgi:hypothetical protein